MKLIQFLTILASAISTTSAIALHKKNDGNEPRVISFDLHRNNIRDPIAHDRRRQHKRSGSIDVGLDNEVSCFIHR
jgi:hypothetical protein